MKDIIAIYRAKRMKNTDPWRLEPSVSYYTPTVESTPKKQETVLRAPEAQSTLKTGNSFTGADSRINTKKLETVLCAPKAQSFYEMPVAICVPVCNEYPGFFETLDSLEKSASVCESSVSCEKSVTITYDCQKHDRIAVFCAINNRASDKSEVIENNRHLLSLLNCTEKSESHTSETTTALKTTTVPEAQPTPKTGKSFARTDSGINTKKLGEVLHAPKAQPTPKTLDEVLHASSTVERWPHLELFVIDCCTSGRELPEGQGVGLARKIAMDSALCFGAKVIACLDADTLVKDNYLSVLLEFGKKNNGKITATCTSFVHQKGSTAQIEEAIRAYEKFLHHHSESLKKCGTPFYHVALGPTLICTAEAYCACNGMNPRVAGEDFYFLQSLEKVCASSGGVTEIDTCVYPSPRISDRVLFGTGTKLQGIIDGTDDAKLYPDWVYKSIADFITLIKSSIQDFCNATAPKPEPSTKNTLQSGKYATQTMSSALRSSMTIRLLQKKMQDDYPAFHEFLTAERFFDTWEKVLQHSSNDTKKIKDAFFAWFDGLKMIRFIHYLMH